MLETKSIHLAGGRDSIAVVCEADKGKALGHTCVAVLCKEHTRDAAEALEHVPQLPFLCHLGNLDEKKNVSMKHDAFGRDIRVNAYVGNTQCCVVVPLAKL